MNEAALMPLSSLKGAVKMKVEHVPLADFNHDGGIDFLVDQLRYPYEEQMVNRKHKVLNDYEHIRRNSGERPCDLTKRYRRVETALRSVGCDLRLICDDEARGHRLLDKAVLSPETRRAIIVAAGCCFEFACIRDTMVMLFPEIRAAPPLVNASGQVILSRDGGDR